MDKSLKIEYIPIGDIRPYENNAKLHPQEQIQQIKNSILEFGFDDPIAVWKDNIIIEGHGRLIAAQELGYKEIPIIRLDGLTDEQRRAYTLVHNQLTMNSGFDIDMLNVELGGIGEIDMSDFGFEFVPEFDAGTDFFENRDRNDTSREEGNEEYNDFLEKFEPKKTTDDCYTPDLVYSAVADWVCKEYGKDSKDFVRPFYPGGDYQKYKYPEGCVVVDNPPFSILSEILKFYAENKIDFFLFAPALTLFSSSSSYACALCVSVTVTYENGANVATSFLTSLENGMRLRSVPELYSAVSEANKQNLKERKKELPKFEYCDYVVTSTRCAAFSKYNIDFRVPISESALIRQLDEQKESGKCIFGSGYLISERLKLEKEKAEREKAEREKAEREKAEREKAERWELSEREMEIVQGLK